MTRRNSSATRGQRATHQPRSTRRPIRLDLEPLEDRTLLTAYVFVEFGDNFPLVNGMRVLTTTVGAVRDVAAAQQINNNPIPNTVIQGPQLTNANNPPQNPTDPSNLYPDNTAVNLTSFNNNATIRGFMMDAARGVFNPLDVRVVELTATPQTLPDGRVVAGAANMAGVVATLRGNNTTTKDLYVIVATPGINPTPNNPNGNNPINFATNGYGGIAPTGTVLGELADLQSSYNRHDDLILNFRNDADTIVHEAGHAFGLQHAVTTAAPAGSAINNAIHESEVMSYLSGGSSFFFSRYPMTRGDDNTDPNTGTNPPTPPPLNSNDLAARQGVQTPFDQLVVDPNIGQNPSLRYVSGTGAHDIITITRRDASFATITVQAFADANYTSPIQVPGSSTANTTFTYPLSLDRSILVEGGLGNDRIVLAGNLGIRLTVDGMVGTDSLVLRNTSLLTSNFELGEGVALARIGSQFMTVIHDGLERVTVEAGRLDTVDVIGVRRGTPVTIDTARTVAISYPGVRGDVNIVGRGRTDLTVNDASTSPTAFRVRNDVLLATVGGLTRDVDYQGLRSLTVNGGSGGNRFEIDNTPAAPVTLNTGLGVDTVDVVQTNGALTINGQDSRIPNAPDGFDIVNVGFGSVRSIREGLTLTNLGAYSAVNVDNSADTVARTGIIYRNGLYTAISGLTPGADIVLRGRDLSSLTISAGSGHNTFRIHDTPSSNWAGGLTTTLNTGEGSDQVRVNGTTGALALNGQGGFNAITVGSDSTGMDRIQGAVSISSPGGTAVVTIHDRPTPTGLDLTHTITPTAYTRTGAAPVSLSGIHSLVLLAGSAHDTINVQGNPTQQFFSGFDILAGAGNDTINVGNAANQLAGIGTVTTIDGEAGSDTLNLNDQGSTAAKTYTFGLNFGIYPVFSSPDAGITYLNNESVLLNVSSGGSSVAVNGTLAGSSLTVNGYAGASDRFEVSGESNAIRGSVRLLGQTGDADVATFEDSQNTAPRVYTLTTATLRREDQAPVFFSGLVQMILYAPRVGGSTVSVRSVEGSTLANLVVADRDTVTISSLNRRLNNILGPVAVRSYSPEDQVSLIVDDSSNAALTPKTVTLTPPVSPTDLGNHIEGFARNTIYWNLGSQGSVALLGGAADETFAFTNTSFASAISLDGGGGINTLDYSAINGDPSSALVARYAGEGNADDAVGGNHGTLVGGVAFAEGRVGQAFSLDGLDDYVQVPNAANLETPTISVEAWVNSTGPANSAYVVAKGASGVTAASYALYTQGGGLAFYIFDGVNYVESPYADPGIWDGNWHHVVGTFDGSAVRLYVDGVEVGEGTPTELQIGYDLPTTNDLFIGSYQGDVALLFEGLIDEPSIYNRALSLAEIQRLYSCAGLVARYAGEGNADDAVGGNHGTLVGGVTFAEGRVGQAFSFGGVDDYVEIADHPNQSPSSITLEAWVNPDTVDGFQVIMSKYQSIEPGNYSWAFSNNGGRLEFGVYQGETGRVIQTIDQVLTAGVWQHVVGTFDVATQAMSIYVDGVATGTAFLSGHDGPVTAINDSTSPVRIGAIANSDGVVSYFWNGRIDEASLYNRALSSAEIQALSSGGSAGNASGVVVNLPLGTATGLTGGITRIQNVIGSAGNDILVGNDMLVGNGSVLTGGAGRDLLIAGALASFLDGGDDEDLLIAGTTDYDRDAAALMAIMTEWTSASNYATRVANLKNGANGAPILDASQVRTVRSNGGGNTLLGNAGLDFFFANTDDSNTLDTFDRDPATEELVEV